MHMRISAGVLSVIWAACICGTVLALAWYDTRIYTFAPRANTAPVKLPSSSGIDSSAQTSGLHKYTKPTVTIFLHPYCPCSRASLTEFAVLAHEFRGMADFRVLFMKPISRQRTWVERSSLYARAQAMPYCTVNIDDNGVEAALVNAVTSGFTTVYSPEGRLLFSGGITGARGHEGNNPGEEAVRVILRKYYSSRDGKTLTNLWSTAAPTFGCTLRDTSQ
ncbi:MAG: hypothetical protein RML40_07820 [Bacteroidota bacterium]|nr:hypothetical protein [Bacteroidota bacterium]